MLDWLHNTATKMDNSAICVTEEFNLGREIVGFLRTGINMFNENKGYDEIAYYPAIVVSITSVKSVRIKKFLNPILYQTNKLMLLYPDVMIFFI